MLWSALHTVWPTHRVSGRWVSDQYSMLVSTISFQLYSFWHHFEPGHTFCSPFLSSVYIKSVRRCAGYFSVFSLIGVIKTRVVYHDTNSELLFLSLTPVTSVLPAYCVAPSEAGALYNPSDLQRSDAYNPGSEKKCVGAIKNVSPCQQNAFEFWLKIIRSLWSNAQNNILHFTKSHIWFKIGFIGNSAVWFGFTRLEKKEKSVFNKIRHISREDIGSESVLYHC